MKTLTNQEILELSPAAMVTSNTFGLLQDKKTTDKYSFLSTVDIIDAMNDLGWGVIGAKQTSLSPIGVHEITFASDDLIDLFPNHYGIVPQIKFLNAHTGTFAARSFKSIYRQVCSNGLVAQTSVGLKRTPHVGSINEKVNNIILDYIDSLKEVKGVVINASHTSIHHKTAMSLANKAIVARGLDPETVDYKSMLAIKREEDANHDLWSVFNRIQEWTINGGFNINLVNTDPVKGNKEYTLVAPPITNPVKSAKINIALWKGMVDVLEKK